MNRIHVINQIIEESMEYNKPVYMAYIDYEKAFDSLEIPGVIDAVQEAYVNSCANICKDSTAALVLHKKS